MSDALQYCDERLWVEGKDNVCRAFVEAIPAEEREKWKRIMVLSETQLSPLRDGIVYVVFFRDGWFVQLPLREDFLAEPSVSAPLVARRVSWGVVETVEETNDRAEDA